MLSCRSANYLWRQLHNYSSTRFVTNKFAPIITNILQCTPIDIKYSAIFFNLHQSKCYANQFPWQKYEVLLLVAICKHVLCDKSAVTDSYFRYWNLDTTMKDSEVFINQAIWKFGAHKNLVNPI